MTLEDDGSEHVATCPLYLFNKSHWGDFTVMQTSDDNHHPYERAVTFEGELWNYFKSPEGMTFYEERQKKDQRLGTWMTKMIGKGLQGAVEAQDEAVGYMGGLDDHD